MTTLSTQITENTIVELTQRLANGWHATPHVWHQGQIVSGRVLVSPDSDENAQGFTVANPKYHTYFSIWIAVHDARIYVEFRTITKKPQTHVIDAQESVHDLADPNVFENLVEWIITRLNKAAAFCDCCANSSIPVPT